LQYRLYDGSKSSKSNVLETVLENRGITDCYRYMNLDDSVIIPYKKLDNIDEAVDCFEKHYENENTIAILVDEDVDGFCSAGMMYSYIKEMNPNYPVKYILHGKNKAHGLSNDVIITDDIKLLIIPDAGTNDSEQCEKLKIDIIILDHHEKEEDNEHAIIVNNQMSKSYSNKDFCGAGIVYKFLQALDERFWNEYADNYLDLCALANISDVMDIRSLETKRIINKGLSNIRNKCFSSFIEAQNYSMNGRINIHNIQWYITPVINGMIRIGDQEEKELLFRSFIEQDEFFEYKTRARKDKPSEIIQESIYDKAVRLSKNAKSRQDKLKEKSVDKIVEIIKKTPNDNKITILDVTNLLNNGLSGLVAMKIAELFNKPCILLNQYIETVKKDDKKKTTMERLVYGGSARNIDHSPIDSFKDVINSSSAFNWGKGHANAFGVNLDIDKLDEAINSLNYILQDVEYDSTYRCDYILDISEVTAKLIVDLNQFSDIIGQGINEPMLAIENISLDRVELDIIGKNSDTIKFKVGDIEYVQFKCKEGNELFDWLNTCWDDENNITFNIVGKPMVNEYNGVKTMQIVIQDLVVINKTDQEDEEDVW